MFAFAFVADPELSHGTCEPTVRAMLDAWPHVPAENRSVAVSAFAGAGVLRWRVVAHDTSTAPVWDAGRKALFAGDVRLYNRAELIAALGLDQTEQLSDHALAYSAYVRWGADAPLHLRGDFAFAVWDEDQRSLFAARDHMGVRPLYYRIEGKRICLASDIAQILPVARTRIAVNPQAILERFSRRSRTQGLTYFCDLHALPGGHRLVFDRDGVRRDRYWAPPSERRGVAYRDECAEIRELFLGSVRARLDSDEPIIVHSSGGFDSSAIVMAASSIYGEQSTRPALTMASATTPGMPCDDSFYMDAVSKRVPFEGVRWSVFDSPPPVGFDSVSIGQPTLNRGIGGGVAQDLALARRLGARVLLTGLCGDTVLYSFGIFRDMIRSGRGMDVASAAISAGGLAVLVRVVGKALLGFLPPTTSLRWLNRWTNRAPRSPPDWMGPRLRSIFPAPTEDLDIFPGLSSHLATEMWARVTSPAIGNGIFGMVVYGAMEGVEVRVPYVDAGLIERILEIPWEHRLPMGDFRRLGRDALGGLLPDEFGDRFDQGSWSPVWAHHARRMLPAVRQILTQGEWLSAPYVVRDRAVAMLDGCSDIYRESTVDLIRVNEFAMLEAWLRRLGQSVHCDIY